MKKALFLLLALSCLTFPARAVGSSGFYDLTGDHWAAAQIRQAVEAGVVTGYGDGSFQPTRDVTAAQFCAMLSRSFLKEAFAAAPEGRYQAMDACASVLEGTSVETAYRNRGRHWDHFVDQPLSRYDMAQIIYNLAREKDALHETITLSTTDIADWTDIPDGYRSAVFTCWGLGLLQGRSDGRFAGTENLNRAQACVIWSRLDALLNGPYVPPADPDEGVEVKKMPAFGLREGETVQQMMARINRETPPCAEGRLPNGKSRTDENIRELLDLVKQGCPDGTAWSDTVRFDYRSGHMARVSACASFGLAVSDFVFGEDAPFTICRELPTLSVGDVILIRFEESERVLVLTSIDQSDGSYTACELKRNGKVNWGQWGRLSGLIDATDFTTVYKRWA